ncbi:N-acetyltransferase 5 [Conglomerata obtusa]
MDGLILIFLNNSELETFVRMQNSLFPVKYQYKFYVDLIETYDQFGVFICNNGVYIGIASFRLDDDCLYIMTFGILPEYRNCKLGSDSLKLIEHCAYRQHGKEKVMLHVNVANKVAVAFYLKNGYRVKKLVKDYYKNYIPRDAYYLFKYYGSHGWMN